MAHAVTKLNPSRWNRRQDATCPDCGEWYAVIGLDIPVVSYVLYHRCAVNASTSRATGTGGRVRSRRLTSRSG